MVSKPASSAALAAWAGVNPRSLVNSTMPWRMKLLLVLGGLSTRIIEDSMRIGSHALQERDHPLEGFGACRRAEPHLELVVAGGGVVAGVELLQRYAEL